MQYNIYNIFHWCYWISFTLLKILPSTFHDIIVIISFNKTNVLFIKIDVYIQFRKYLYAPTHLKNKLMRELMYVKYTYIYVRTANAQKCVVKSCSCFNPVFNGSSFNVIQ